MLHHPYDPSSFGGYPPLITTATPNRSDDSFKALIAGIFKANYCLRPLVTPFGTVRFSFKRDFNHAFFELGPDGPKSRFSILRAERVLWIKHALQDPKARHVQGYDKARGCCHRGRRTILVPEHRYVVVVQPAKGDHHIFITAFVATTDHSWKKLLHSPDW